MKIITINLPEKYLNAIQVLNDLGRYSSRSEAIRAALEDFLKAEIEMDANLEEERFKSLMTKNLKARN